MQIAELSHCLDDPVHIAELLEVVFEVAHCYQPCESSIEESGRLGFLGRLQPRSGNLVARRALAAGRNDVEQVACYSSVGEMSGDACAHGSGAKNGNSMDLFHGVDGGEFSTS